MKISSENILKSKENNNMPTPEKGETEKEFIGRCIPILIDEGKEKDQAVAICYSIWKNKDKKSEEKSTIDKIDNYLNEASRSENFPELDEIAEKFAKEVLNKINKEVKNVKSKMPYKSQYVLEEIIRILEDAV